MSLRMTEEEYAEFQRRNYEHIATSRHTIHPPFYIPAPPLPAAETDEKPKRQKYGNRRVEIDGMKFDSQHEAKYYFSVLVPRIRAGELAYVLRQVPFELPGGIKYMADFVAVLPGGRIEAVIDAKSEPTRKNRVYINKKKQMKACFGIEILEV